MKAKELIAQLQRFNPDYEVIICDSKAKEMPSFADHIMQLKYNAEYSYKPDLFIDNMTKETERFGFESIDLTDKHGKYAPCIVIWGSV